MKELQEALWLFTHLFVSKVALRMALLRLGFTRKVRTKQAIEKFNPAALARDAVFQQIRQVTPAESHTIHSNQLLWGET